MIVGDVLGPLRILLGDDVSTGGTQKFKDEQLIEGVKTVFITGLAPECLIWSDPSKTFTDPITPDTLGMLLVQAALLLTVGPEVFSYQTRPLSVRRFPEDKKIRVDFLFNLLANLEDKGSVCSASGSTDGIIAMKEDCVTSMKAFLLPPS